MKRPPPPVLALVAVLALSFAWHAYLAANPTTGYQSSDERSYGRLAVELADDHAYGSTDRSLHWPPGAPVFFAVAHALFPSAQSATTYDIPAAYWFQAILSIGTALAAFGIVWAVAGAWPGVLGAALVAFYPPLVLATGEQLSEPVGAFFLTAGMCAVALTARAGRAWGLAVAGGLLALAVLSRADLLPIPFLVAALTGIAVWRRRGALLPGAGAAALMAGATVLVLAPWTIYATMRADAFVPVTTGSSSALFVGTYLPGGGTTVGMKRALGAEAKRLNPRLRGTADFDLEARSVLAVVAARHPDLAFDDAVAREGRENLRRYALGDPLGFGRMMLDKGVMRMWSRYARGGARHTSWVIRTWHIVLVLAAMTGIVAGLTRRFVLVLGAVAIAVGCSTAIHMVLVSQARYNLPLMPSVIAAGVAGWALFAGARRARAADPAASAAPVAASA